MATPLKPETLMLPRAGAVSNTTTYREADVNDATADQAMETAVKWAQLYAAACGEVSSAANACLEVANRVVGARGKIVECQNGPQMPGTPIAIRNFTKYAEDAEREFAPLYRAFAEACANARDTAANFLSAQTVHDPEFVLIVNVPQDAADNVAVVKEILRANYGHTPEGFIEGVQETNELLENPPEAGNIYTPPPPVESDERTCPWCAETIKAAAIICRFCNRDVQVQSEAG
jgi:hypothetical protein